MNELQVKNAYTMALERATEDEVIKALSASVYPGATEPSVRMVLAYCKAGGLDPLMKPVHIVPMNVKDSKTGKYDWRDVIMPGIGLYRIQASRTNECVGISRPEFGPVIKLNLGGVEIDVPEWCRVTVKRNVNGVIAEYTAEEYWIENYATAGKDSQAPNSMWKKRPRGQLGKCTEAQALRKAFPEVGSQPTAEEMEGREEIEVNPAPQKAEKRGEEIIIVETGEVIESEKRPEPPEWPADQFAKALPTWERVIMSGKHTHKDVIARAESSGKLTDDQRKTIEAIKGPENASS